MCKFFYPISDSVDFFPSQCLLFLFLFFFFFALFGGVLALSGVALLKLFKSHRPRAAKRMSEINIAKRPISTIS